MPNNLTRYKVGDTVLLSSFHAPLRIEATIVFKVDGKGKKPAIVKVQSKVALDQFGYEHNGENGRYTVPAKTAWIMGKDWYVVALIARPVK